jgi:hypothetical protein
VLGGQDGQAFQGVALVAREAVRVGEARGQLVLPGAGEEHAGGGVGEHFEHARDVAHVGRRAEDHGVGLAVISSISGAKSWAAFSIFSSTGVWPASRTPSAILSARTAVWP